MPFNILLLPLLGGYIFISRCNRFRFDAKRQSGYRLIFNSAVAGFILMAVAYVSVRVALWIWPTGAYAIHDFVGVEFPYFLTSLLALILGTVAHLAANRWFFEDKKESEAAIQRQRNYLEMMLSDAMGRSVSPTEVDSRKLISVTCTSKKVYVGHVISNFDPSYDRIYIALLPYFSGYRDPETQELVLTNDYLDIWEDIQASENAETEEGRNNALTANDLQVVIPLSSIQTVNRFEREVFKSDLTHPPDSEMISPRETPLA